MKVIGNLTLLEFEPADFKPAQALCAQMGYGESFAYCTSSDLPGLYCLPLRQHQKQSVICKTAEFGFIIVQTPEE